MAIARTALTDDDGTGFTGSIFNNAWKQELYDQLDESLVTPQTTTSTGTVNDFALTARCTFLRCNNATLLTLTGFAAGFDGQRVEIVSVGAGQVDIPNQNASSTAANRVINSVTATISLAAGTGRMRMVYDGTTARWRVTFHEQGAWISVTPTYSGNGTLTYGTVTTTHYRYVLRGRMLHLIFAFSGTVAGTGSAIQATLPGAFTPAVTGGIAFGPARISDATPLTAFGQMQLTSTNLQVFKDFVPNNFAVGAATCQGEVAVEVQ